MDTRRLECSFATFFAWCMWGTAAVTLTLATIVHMEILAFWGLAASAAAATLHMRSFVLSLNDRDEDRFELGRDVGRAESSGVRPIR